MLWKNAFIHTLREDPADAELVSHRLMVRAGMIQKVASGIYDYLPLGLRVVRKIEAIVREEMARCGAAELLMPAVVPAELWQESGRWQYYGPELLRFHDRKDNQFCLGPTHEEVIVDVARRAVRSYRDLPFCLYQIQSKFRDEVRPRYGLMRGREFIMKDAYSFHADETSLDELYWIMHKAYTAIFSRAGLNFRPVEADSGAIGGDVTHEFHVLADSGEDTIAYCDACTYAANIEKATKQRSDAEQQTEVPHDALLPSEVATPGKKSIDEVSAFLKVAPSQTIKMLIYSVNEGEYLVAVCIRGDLELNEMKLKNVLGADTISIPDDSLLQTRLAVPVGYLGAHKLDRTGIQHVLADYSIKEMTDAVCGANKKDHHLLHIYPSRDLTIDRYCDVGFVAEDDHCPRCASGTLKLRKGIEVGQIFKLGTKYSKPMQMTFLDETGTPNPVTMGCYGIGIGRTAAAAIEQNYDADGIIWPIDLAPYTVAVLSLDCANEEVMQTALTLHDQLEKQGFDVILDDRDERPGVKFKDADLIGFPVRVVVGARGLQNGQIEVRKRCEKNSEKVSVDNALSYIIECIHALRATHSSSNVGI